MIIRQMCIQHEKKGNKGPVVQFKAIFITLSFELSSP